MSENPTKFRVQFDFAPEAYEELSELQTELQVPTKAEVVRCAIRTLRWVVTTVGDGQSILVEDNGATKEVIFPFVVNANCRGKKKRVRPELVSK
jgi:hypothetical protein